FFSSILGKPGNGRPPSHTPCGWRRKPSESPAWSVFFVLFKEDDLILFLLLLERDVCRVTSGQERDKGVLIRNPQQSPDRLCVLLLVTGNPAGPHPIGLEGDAQDLGGCTAVLEVILRLPFTKYGKTDRGIGNEPPVIGQGGDLLQQVSFPDDPDQPGLEIHCSRGEACTFDGIPDDRVLDRNGFVTPDTVPAFDDGGSDIHEYPLAVKGKNGFGLLNPPGTDRCTEKSVTMLYRDKDHV